MDSLPEKANWENEGNEDERKREGDTKREKERENTFVVKNRVVS